MESASGSAAKSSTLLSAKIQAACEKATPDTFGVAPLPAVSELIEEERRTCVGVAEEQRAWDWLKSLDSGKGALLRYFPALRDQFDCAFAQLSAAKLEKPISSGKLGYVEPSVFEALEMHEVEHKLLLAAGIAELPDF